MISILKILNELEINKPIKKLKLDFDGYITNNDIPSFNCKELNGVGTLYSDNSDNIIWVIISKSVFDQVSEYLNSLHIPFKKYDITNNYVSYSLIINKKYITITK